MRLDRGRLCLLQAMLLCGLSPGSRAEFTVTKVGDSVVDAKALTVRGPYGPRGRLHVTWVWRERTQGANHDIMYAYSEDRRKTWLSNTGEVVGTFSTGKAGEPTRLRIIDFS